MNSTTIRKNQMSILTQNILEAGNLTT